MKKRSTRPHAGQRKAKRSKPGNWSRRQNKQKMETVQTSAVQTPVIKTKAPLRALSSFKPKDQLDILAVQKIMAGDTAAFITIWDRYIPWFVQKAFHMVGNHDEAEDIAHSVLGKAYEQIMKGNYRPTYTFNSWINFMFGHYMVDYSRKAAWKNKGLTVSMDNTMTDGDGAETSFAETMADPDASSDALTLRNEQKKAVREALATLDDIGRLLIGMFYGQQKSQRLYA